MSECCKGLAPVNNCRCEKERLRTANAPLVRRIERYLAALGQPMDNGRANPDNDMIYLLRDCCDALTGAHP